MRRKTCLHMLILLCMVMMIFVSCGNKYSSLPKEEKKEVPMQESDKERREDLYPASSNTINGKWGYTDKTGKFIIEPSFSSAQNFQENGLALVGTDKGFGLIDKSGKYIVEPVYDYISGFSEGFAIAYSGPSLYKVLNEKGHVIFEMDSGYIYNFSDGLSAFTRTDSSGNMLYGFIDTQGNVVIEPRYLYVNPFKDGKALVQLEEGKYALINKKGEVISTFNHYSVGNINEGLMPFKDGIDEKFGYIDEAGKVVIKPQFLEANQFKDGIAVVNASEDYTENKYGAIDKNSKYIIEAKYNSIERLGEKMLAVGIALDEDMHFKGSKSAVADTEGNILTDFVFYKISEFKNGIASVDDGEHSYFIDNKGKQVETLPIIKGSYDLEIVGQLIKVDSDGIISYIDKAGQVIYKPSTEVKLDNGITVRQLKHKPNRYYIVFYPQIEGMGDKIVQDSVNKKLKDMSIDEAVEPDTKMDYSYTGEFSVELHKKDLLVLKLTGYNYPFGAAHGMPIMDYVHLDLKSGKFYELKDLFKADSDYVKKLSDIVGEQIKEKGEEMGVWADSYTGIKENQPFFLTEDSLNLYFYPYEIGPYAIGFPTFTIPFGQIMDMIDTAGEFWKAIL
jgi:hypothetical protein